MHYYVIEFISHKSESLVKNGVVLSRKLVLLVQKGPLRGLRRTIHLCTLRILSLLYTLFLAIYRISKFFVGTPHFFSAEDIRGVKGGEHAKNCGDRSDSFLKHCAQPTGTFLLVIRYTIMGGKDIRQE